MFALDSVIAGVLGTSVVSSLAATTDLLTTGLTRARRDGWRRDMVSESYKTAKRPVSGRVRFAVRFG